MKFYNKRHKVRLRCWTMISISSHQSPLSIKQELWNWESDGKFFIEDFIRNSTNVWFERKEDAVWFALKWK